MIWYHNFQTLNLTFSTCKYNWGILYAPLIIVNFVVYSSLFQRRNIWIGFWDLKKRALNCKKLKNVQDCGWYRQSLRSIYKLPRVLLCEIRSSEISEATLLMPSQSYFWKHHVAVLMVICMTGKSIKNYKSKLLSMSQSYTTRDKLKFEREIFFDFFNGKISSWAGKMSPQVKVLVKKPQLLSSGMGTKW